MSVGALQEAVISVTDLNRAESFFRDVGGYETIYKGTADESQGIFWNMPDIGATEILLAAPDTEHGFVRLIAFNIAEPMPIRVGLNAWDTGGFYSLNVQVNNALLTQRAMTDAGWISHSGLHEHAFASMVMRQMMLQGPDSVSITLIERLSPPVDEWTFIEFSPVKNMVQTVTDFDKSKQFFTEYLGFNTIFDAPILPDADGDNLFGLPHNIAPQINAHIGIFQPPQTTQSTIEIIHLAGVHGHDFSSRAVPPNLGVMMARFEVEDLIAYHSEIVFRGAIVHIPPAPVIIEPYGEGMAMVVRTPDGAWIEFIEMPKG